MYVDPLTIQNVPTVDNIVGDGSNATYTDLQSAINSTPSGGVILVQKMCTVDATIYTNSKAITLAFEGSNTGLVAGLATVGLRIDWSGCIIKGFGSISGFTTGIDVDAPLTRIEMVFTGNTTNLDIMVGIDSTQVIYQGSYGLAENSQIETSIIDGSIARWSDSKKRWEPISGLTADSSGSLTATTLIATGV